MPPDDDRGQHGTAKSRQVELDGIQGERAPQFGSWDKAGHNRQKHRAIERPDNAFQKGKRDNDPGRGLAEERGNRQTGAERTQQRFAGR